MRLLNVHTRKLETFHSSGETLLYAILSHTWGLDEITFEDIQSARPPTTKTGWEKVSSACNKAEGDGFDYIWIDTCCIDKSSSSELSEAINSMFQWYESARVCYVYLEDTRSEAWLARARWFTRGWTLQELLAPRKVLFYSQTWELLGDRQSLRRSISDRTGIDSEVLRRPELLSSISIARRMSWASQRETTRPEDVAYCLMGIFGVNMPLLYGEGTNAFIRLQEEIMKDSEDESIFAWDRDTVQMRGGLRYMGILALSPAFFAASLDILSYTSNLDPYAMTNRGLRIQIPVLKPERNFAHFAVLHCRRENDLGGPIAIPIRLDSASGRFFRDAKQQIITVSHQEAAAADVRTIFILKTAQKVSTPGPSLFCHLRSYPEAQGFEFCDGIAVPAKDPGTSHSALRWLLEPDKESASWNMTQRAMTVEFNERGHFAALKFTCRKTAFAVILELPTYVSGKVSLVLLGEANAHESMKLSTVLHANYQNLERPVFHLHTALGTIKARLERTLLFGEEIYVVDLDLDSVDQNEDLPLTTPTLEQIDNT